MTTSKPEITILGEESQGRTFPANTAEDFERIKQAQSYDPRTFQALAIAKGIEVWLETGCLVNPAYKPGAMKGTAERILGKKFSGTLRVGLKLAAAELREWAEERGNLNA